MEIVRPWIKSSNMEAFESKLHLKIVKKKRRPRCYQNVDKVSRWRDMLLVQMGMNRTRNGVERRVIISINKK